MNAVDSCGWIEYFTHGPNAGVFAEAIEVPENLIVPSICIYEVYRATLRERGENAARDAVGAMLKATTVPLDPLLAVAAAQLGVERGLPLADSVIYATARARGATLWSQDDHFRDMDGVEYVEVK